MMLFNALHCRCASHPVAELSTGIAGGPRGVGHALDSPDSDKKGGVWSSAWFPASVARLCNGRVGGESSATPKVEEDSNDAERCIATTGSVACLPSNLASNRRLRSVDSRASSGMAVNVKCIPDVGRIGTKTELMQPPCCCCCCCCCCWSRPPGPRW